MYDIMQLAKCKKINHISTRIVVVIIANKEIYKYIRIYKWSPWICRHFSL